MINNLHIPAPTPTVKRLPSYLEIAGKALASGRKTISATKIANQLNLLPIQVRKDLAVLDITGRPSIGFQVTELIDALKDFLGWKNATDAFLVGAGSLGKAISGYKRFSQCGLNIVAAFDTSHQKIGEMLSGIEVLSLQKLPSLAERMHIHIGVLTVPGIAAQECADLMVSSGIIAIWNFTPVQLKIPENVIVENVLLASSFAVLSSKLQKKLLENV